MFQPLHCDSEPAVDAVAAVVNGSTAHGAIKA